MNSTCLPHVSLNDSDKTSVSYRWCFTMMSSESGSGYKFVQWLMDLQYLACEAGAALQPPSTHPEDFLFAQLRRGNLDQMWLQTKEKLPGLEVGSGPSFAWPQDLLLPGIRLFFSSSALSPMISCKFSSRGCFNFYSSTAVFSKSVPHHSYCELYS